jgi:hypothetical protein
MRPGRPVKGRDMIFNSYLSRSTWCSIKVK